MIDWLKYESLHRGQTTEQAVEHAIKTFSDNLPDDSGHVLELTKSDLVSMVTNIHQQYLALCQIRENFAPVWYRLHEQRPDLDLMEVLKAAMPCEELEGLDPIQDEDAYAECLDDYQETLRFVASGVIT